MTDLIEHGTREGYNRHIRNSEMPCPPCAAAKSDATQASKIRTGKTAATRVPVAVLGDLLLGLEEHKLDEVSDVLGHEVVAACMEIAAWQALSREAEIA
jgi:hypothetical protein